jgi:glucan phosphoethanolaminetransferase (alkaline phosphatase superfamily)
MPQKKYNLIAIVVFITLIEGLAIYINIVVHPELQPALTAVIAILTAIVSGFMTWYVTRVRGIILT